MISCFTRPFHEANLYTHAHTRALSIYLTIYRSLVEITRRSEKERNEISIMTFSIFYSRKSYCLGGGGVDHEENKRAMLA